MENYNCSIVEPSDGYTDEFIKRAMELQPTTLIFLGDTEYNTRENCELAVAKMRRMVSEVPVEYLDKDMFNLALSSGDQHAEVWADKMRDLRSQLSSLSSCA